MKKILWIEQVQCRLKYGGFSIAILFSSLSIFLLFIADSRERPAFYMRNKLIRFQNGLENRLGADSAWGSCPLFRAKGDNTGK